MIENILGDIVQTDERYNIDLNSSKSKKFIKDLLNAIHELRNDIKKNKIKFKDFNIFKNNNFATKAASSSLFNIKRHYSSKVSKIINDYVGFNCMFFIDDIDEYNAYYLPNVDPSDIVTHISTTTGKAIGRGDVLLRHDEAISHIKEINEISHTNDLSSINNKASDILFNYFIVVFNGLMKNTEFSDEEIVSVILHEIGHSVSFITETAQEFHSSSMWGDIVEYSMDDDRSVEELNELLDEINKIKKEIKEEDIKKNTKQENILNFLPILQIWTRRSYKSTIDKLIKDDIASLIIKSLIMSIINIFIIKSVRNYLNKEKHGDKLGDSYDIAFHERWADEYVAEHGMAAHQSSILRKMRIFTADKSNRLEKEINAIFLLYITTIMLTQNHSDINKIIKINNSVKLFPMNIPYDNSIDRSSKLRLNTYKLFKRKDITPKIKKQLSEQIKHLDKDINEMKKLKKDMRRNKEINPITKKLQNLLNTLISGKMITSPGDKFTKDLEDLYYEMHERNESFVKNRFEYLQWEIDKRK